MVGWYDSIEDREWLTQPEAAEAFRCSPCTIRAIAKEMVQLGLDGVWMSHGKFRFIDKKALSDYLYRRSKIRTDRRLGRE